MAIISKTPFNFKLRWGDITSKPEASREIAQPKDNFIKLIVGLGNIGKKYEGTRHNIGFKILEQYAKLNSFTEFKENKKFFGLTSEKFIEGTKVILLKPTTMMNLSGTSILSLSQFYNIKPENITIIHDELDLPFGTVKLKAGGEGKSSHNGLKDASAKLKTNNYNRIRFGIKNELLEKMDSKDFVLGKFNKAEQAKLKELIQETINLI